MKVLVIGLGSIARKHIKALNNISDKIEIYALRSNANASVEAGIHNIYQFAELDAKTIDFIIISNPTNLHKKTIKSLLEYNIPLFIEKPIFDDLNALPLLEEIERKNIITYVACNLRFLGCISFVKEFIKDKRVNEVNSYCGSYLPDWRPGKDFRKIYSANKDMGGGVHIDLIHEMDYIYWFFGAPNYTYSTKTSHSSLKINAVDYANYLLEYPLFCVNIILNYYRKDAKRSLEVLLDEGTLIVNLLKNQVTFNDMVIFESSKNVIDTYEDQLRFFIEQVITEKTKFNTAAEAFKILKLCIARD